MKTLTAQALEIQNSVGDVPDALDRVILYEQHTKITAIVSSTSIRVDGDVTTEFSDGDEVFFPLRSFTVNFTLNATPTFSAGETTLAFSGAPLFVAVDIGQVVCSVLDITTKLIDNAISEGVVAIEGNTLQEFDSGELSIKADNGTGFFQKRDSTGIFDSGNPFWGKYLTGFKSTTLILWFGGEVDLSELEPDLFNKTIKFKIYGHSRTLEHIPAFNISDTSGVDLMKIPGFEIDSFDSSVDTEEGIKQIDYNPFDSGKLKGVEIISVSDDTESGIYVLEFKYPHDFRWDNGAYETIDEVADLDDAAAGTEKLFSRDGVKFVIVKLGDSSALNEFPDVDSEMWVSIKQKESVKQIGEQGTPTMRFDKGSKEVIKLHFPRILNFDDSAGTYTEVEGDINTIEIGVNVAVLVDNSDEFWLIASERFFGFEVFMEIPFITATINFKYSTGGNVFSSNMNLATNGLVDGTSNLTQFNGKIIWTTADNWRVGVLVISDTISYKGYIIKISRTAATGICQIKEIRRFLRLRGQNGDFLNLKTIQLKLLPVENDDEVIIRRNDDDTFSVAIWYQNVALQQVLETALDEANFGSGKRNIDDMKVNLSSARFNIWGKPPSLNHPFRPYAITVDGTNEFIYAGIGLEFWRASFKGTWEKLLDIKDSITEPDATFVIREMFNDSTDVYFLVYRYYDDGFGDFGFDVVTKAWLFSWNKSSKILTQHNTPAQVWEPMKKCFRSGKSFLNLGLWKRIIGQDDPNSEFAGENVAIPFRQLVSVQNPGLGNNNVYTQAQSLDDTDTLSPFLWTFEQFITIFDGPYYWADMGIYFIADASSTVGEFTSDLILWYEYGNQSSVLKASNLTDFFIFKGQTDTNGDTFYGLTGVRSDGNRFLLAAVYKRLNIPICIARDPTLNSLYFGFTQWHDDEEDSISYSFVTEWDKNRVHPWDEVWQFNTTGSVFTSRTTEANNETNVPDITDEIGDIIYFGLVEKFRGLSLIGLDASYAFEYWNGIAWAVLSDTPDDLDDLRLVFSIPRNWTLTTVNGGASLYFVRLRVTAISANDDLTTGFCMERVLFDSQTFAGGGETAERYMPIALEYNILENSLHGIMYNRENAATESFPFQWEYFVIDLSDDSIYFFNLTNDGTAVGFTFDGSLLPKNLLLNLGDNRIWFVFENVRYQDSAAFVCAGEYSLGAITLTKIGTPIEQDWGSQVTLVQDSVSDNIFGISQGISTSLWEYGTTFWPRVEIAKFDERDTIKDVLSFIAERSISHWMIHSERTIRMVTRGTANGSIILEWDKNMVNSRPKIPFWKHYYDSIRVDYESFISEGAVGVVKAGFTGFQKKVLDIRNPLIQDIHQAKLVLDEAFIFFNNYRLNPKIIKLSYMIQLELIDKFALAIPKEILDLSLTTEFVIEKLRLNPSTRQVIIEGIEILP